MDLWSPCGVHVESVGEGKVQPRNGYPLGTLNQGIDVPHRYPKMGD